ncbi:hypothetical protein CR513_51960, partial [Mucuna pruriens]
MRDEERRDIDLDVGKCKIPPFVGNYKLEVYIDWELKVEGVRLVNLEFGDYALIWWNSMSYDMRKGIIDPCEDWYDLKRMMRKRSMEEFHKEMEMIMVRAWIREKEEVTIAKFMHGLNIDIQDVVDLHNYGSLGELVHQVVKVEMQLKMRSASRRSTTSTNGWKGRDREKEKVRSDRSPKKGSEPFQGPKELFVTPFAPSTSKIKWFNCLGKDQ